MGKFVLRAAGLMLALTFPIYNIFTAPEECSATEPEQIRQGNFPVPVILDTDFAPDVDDVGALALLHVLADEGEAEILGVMVSSGNHYAPRAVDTINTYYGRPDIPIGASWTPTVTTDSPYTMALALDFPNDLVPTFDTVIPDAVALYREILASQPDHSVTIVSIGFLTNLQGLIASEHDDISEMTGQALIEAKVARLIVMGGDYPDSSSLPAGEYNFAMDAAATYDVITQWRTPIIFSGFHPGIEIETGAVLQAETPVDHPARVAYELYTGDDNRPSWDLTAVHYAVRGTDKVWYVCGPGRNEVEADGTNRWAEDRRDNHYYIANAVAISQIERLLDELLIQPPNRGRS